MWKLNRREGIRAEIQDEQRYEKEKKEDMLLESKGNEHLVNTKNMPGPALYVLSYLIHIHLLRK